MQSQIKTKCQSAKRETKGTFRGFIIIPQTKDDKKKGKNKRTISKTLHLTKNLR